MATEIDSFLPYHEPGIVTILIQSSFLLILNVANTIFDKLIFCGLLGQVFIGVAWGTPGAKWLSEDIEDVIAQLGYLGLILLVYEGGLETNFTSLKANLFLSTAVAITGIGFPIALSFVLRSLVNATPIQAFAAGAALCSTSLGTTFTILSTSGLSSTRLGTVLSSAAMMDDVVGLVMVQVISNLGASASSFSAVTVVRPLSVSVGFAIAVPLFCWGVVKPFTATLNGMRKSNPKGVVQTICGTEYTAFIVHTLILLGLVTAATYAGTSNLFAAYLAGASISWWDSEVLHLEGDVAEPAASNQQDRPAPVRELIHTPSSNQQGTSISGTQRVAANASNGPVALHGEEIATSGSTVYHKYYATAVQRILKPFFFASIGFAIPITQMFGSEIVWRGIIYTILMLFAKLVTGLWLVRLNISRPKLYTPKSLRALVPPSCFRWMYGKSRTPPIKAPRATESHKMDVATKQGENVGGGSTPETATAGRTRNPDPETSSSSSPVQPSPAQPPKIAKPLSLYPATMLGTAMTARGEIGFLIASLAETTGLFSSPSEPGSGGSEIYLVVTWAIVLCTIIGPLSVGTLVKRVRRLQSEREVNPGRGDPLGIWGVS